MATDPHGYLVFTEKYDEYKARAVTHKTAEKAHANDSRESTLRNTVQQEIAFYALYLYRLGLVGELEGQRLVLTREAYEGVTAQLCGEKRRICGLSCRTETVSPSDEDVDRVIMVLEMYRGI